MTRLPTFVVIGSMKGGTTSLFEYLRAHPQVFMPPLKEVDFFTEELNWRRGRRWYESQFADAPPTAIALGEASTSYTKYPRYRGVPQRIHDLLPEVKLIYVVRDPVERIRSHYQHNVTLGEERHPLDVALSENPAYLDYSRYVTQIEQYLEVFARDQLLVITSEALRADRKATVRQVLTFIGADPDVDIPTLDQEFYRSDARPPYGPLVSGVRNILRRAFPRQVGLWRGTWVPVGLKRALARSQPVAATRSSVDPATAESIRESLREDVRSLKGYVHGDFDGWGIA